MDSRSHLKGSSQFENKPNRNQSVCMSRVQQSLITKFRISSPRIIPGSLVVPESFMDHSWSSKHLWITCGHTNHLWITHGPWTIWRSLVVLESFVDHLWFPNHLWINCGPQILCGSLMVPKSFEDHLWSPNHLWITRGSWIIQFCLDSADVLHDSDLEWIIVAIFQCFWLFE